MKLIHGEIVFICYFIAKGVGESRAHKENILFFSICNAQSGNMPHHHYARTPSRGCENESIQPPNKTIARKLPKL